MVYCILHTSEWLCPTKCSQLPLSISLSLTDFSTPAHTQRTHTHIHTHTHTHTHTLRPTWEACLPLCACNSTHILFRRLALLLLLRLLPPMKCLPYHLPWCPYPWLHPVHSFRHKGKAEWGEITVLACFHVCFSVVFSLGYF